jgi:hypothetical protein
MGASNSPALAGRYGAAFLELLRLKSQHFQGQVHQNTWWAHYAFDKPLDPELGHGLVTIGKDGSPVALAWGHCDDFLLHSPTRVKTLRALHDFLDLAVDAGLLCHPGKLTPPSQVVKYTGYLFDTTLVPTLKIPEYKVDRGLALVSYALCHKNHISPSFSFGCCSWCSGEPCTGYSITRRTYLLTAPPIHFASDGLGW